jgi:exonuclease SbcC
MILNRLKLDNFRQHVDTELEFGPGMTAIIGENGAGKTTVLDALLVALFGLRTEVTDKKETYRNHFGTLREGFTVTLDFTFGGDRYRVTREESTATLILLDRNEVIAKGLIEVTAAVQRLLRMNGRQFVNSFCARQKQLAFLDFSKDRRREEVARMLDYHRVKSAAELAMTRRKDLEREIESQKLMLEDREALAEERRSVEMRLAEAKEAVARLQSERERINRALIDLERLARNAERYQYLSAELAKREEAIRVRKGEITSAEDRLRQAKDEEARWNNERHVLDEAEKLDAEIARYDELADSYTKRSAVLGAIEALENERRATEAAMQAIPASRLEEAQQAMAEAQRRAREADVALREAQRRWQDIQKKRAAETARTSEALRACRAELAKAEKLAAAGICPTCEQPLTSGAFEQAIADRRRAVDQAEVEHENAQKAQDGPPPDELAAAEREKRDADERHTNAQNVLDLETERQKERDRLVRQLGELDSKLRDQRAALGPEIPPYDRGAHQAAKARRDSIKAAVKSALALKESPDRARRAQEELARLQAELEKHMATVSELQQERSTLPIESEADAQARRDELVAARTDLKQLDGRIKESQQASEGVAKELERLAERERRLSEQVAVLQSKSQERDLNAVVATSLQELHAELSRRARPQLAEKASRHLEVLTHGRYSNLRLDEDFEAEIDDHGVYKRILSGGEEDVVALSLRLAFSEMIQERHGVSISLLILDEVFGSLDEDRRHLLVERLRLLRNRFDQVLVISHIEEVNQTADRCLRLRRDPRSRATVVESQSSGFDRITLA